MTNPKKNSNVLFINGCIDENTNSFKITNNIAQDHKIINLAHQNIEQFNHLNKYPNNDDFISIINQLVLNEIVVFVSPVYWYSTTYLFKKFMDRFTELIINHPNTLNKLHNKKILFLSFYADGLESTRKLVSDQIQKFSEYLKMDFIGSCYLYTGKNVAKKQINQNNIDKLKDFLEKSSTLQTKDKLIFGYDMKG